MGRGKKHRGRMVRHHESCVCNRCLDDDAKKVEEALEASWEKYNRDNGIQMAHIRLSVKDSPVIGPYDGDDITKALFVTCPMAIVGHITPLGRRRK